MRPREFWFVDSLEVNQRGKLSRAEWRDRFLRERSGSAIAACLMSGDTDVALIVRARAAGLTLLHKPVRPAKLRSLIRRLAAAEPA